MGNLDGKQVEFARNFTPRRIDLLNLINDILDLSKIESGTVTVEPRKSRSLRSRIPPSAASATLLESKNLPFYVECARRSPAHVHERYETQRLQQIGRNLLSNAFKFTARGQVKMSVGLAQEGWSPEHPTLGRGSEVISIAISDTGIGIAPESSASFSRPSSRPTRAPRANTAAPVSASRFPASWRRSSAARFASRASRARAARSRSTCRSPTRDRPRPRSASFPIAPPRRSRCPSCRSPAREKIDDDRNSIEPDDPAVLIVEDDPHYARVLLGLARDKGFRGSSPRAASRRLSLAPPVRTHRDHARYFPARHARVDCAQSPQARARDAAHPGAIITLEEERQHGLSHGAFS